jgi:hypothetical protein
VRWSSLSAFTGFTNGGEVEFGTAIEGIDSCGARKARIPGARPQPVAGRRGKRGNRRAATAAGRCAFSAHPGSFQETAITFLACRVSMPRRALASG